MRVRKDVPSLQEARSGIVHRLRRGLSANTKKDALEKDCDVARWPIIGLIHEGPPPDWKIRPCLASGGELMLFRRREGDPVAVRNQTGKLRMNDCK